MMDMPDSRPEITMEPADNGWVVRHHQRSTKRDEPGRTIRRVASTDDEALGHARTAMGGSKTSKKKSSRDDGAPAEDATSETAPSPKHSGSRHRAGVRRCRPRAAGRRA